MASIPNTSGIPAYTGEKARLSRAFDYLILVLAFFLFIGAFHLHIALTVGDWDFWQDWKDRQWWPLVTPLLMITFPAAVQSVLWTHFRLPFGATLCISCLLIGTWITRIFAYHYWNFFPVNMVLPSTMVPSALVLDAMLMLTDSLTWTAIFGASAFGLLFYPSNWPMFAMFHQPVEIGASQVSIADLYGFQYIRAGMPEYLRIIERGTLRTYGQFATPLSAFFSALLCTLMYTLWWHIGAWFATVRYLKKI
ncbi:methane monooxygenase/ammonia monooxygenase subunit A [Methylomonas paludis]|uniref:Methane monooxygenase/ammonia monooxygenase subunit A n=1 Tax=Methylomonas paludis TaxID=1173101 RepID=A0A975RB54_9GAMM|nr:bacterial ammonia monooxygenase, subunit AmoA [Methylomonas paludis]QWF71931.1 methane monooxygenase/ammonia monooxygenase subunit A [Methylomonas paludis]